VKALDRKLLRNLLADVEPGLTMPLVGGRGVGGFLTTLSAVDSLAYAARTPSMPRPLRDVFADVKQSGPMRWSRRCTTFPGVADVQTTSEFYVRIQFVDAGWRATTRSPASSSASTVDKPPRMNRITLRRGLPDDPVSMSPGLRCPTARCRRGCRSRSPRRARSSRAHGCAR